jgi:hypothetical protein
MGSILELYPCETVAASDEAAKDSEEDAVSLE